MNSWLPSLIRVWIASCSLIVAVKKIPRTVSSVKRIETNSPRSESMPLSTCWTVLPFTSSYLVIAEGMQGRSFSRGLLVVWGTGLQLPGQPSVASSWKYVNNQNGIICASGGEYKHLTADFGALME